MFDDTGDAGAGTGTDAGGATAGTVTESATVGTVSKSGETTAVWGLAHMRPPAENPTATSTAAATVA